MGGKVDELDVQEVMFGVIRELDVKKRWKSCKGSISSLVLRVEGLEAIR